MDFLPQARTNTQYRQNLKIKKYVKRDLDQNLLSLLPTDMPGAGSYDHTNDLISHLHRPDIQIPDLKLYRNK